MRTADARSTTSAALRHQRPRAVVRIGAGTALLLLATAAPAGDGLRLTPQAPADGPRWQWRIGVEIDFTGEPSATYRTSQSGTPLVLGDYLRTPSRWQALGQSWEGAPRATAGLLAEPVPSVPGELRWQPGPPSNRSWPGLSLGGTATTSSPLLWPYLGVGYTGLSRRSGWGFSADVGFIARPPSSGEGAALHGEMGVEETLRRIRLDSLLRLRVQYAF